MHDYVKILDTVIRKTHEEQGMFQASLAERLDAGVHTIINTENFRGSPEFEVLHPLVTTLRTPTDRIFYFEIEPTSGSKQQLLQELRSLNEEEALELLPVIHCLTEMMHRHRSENP